MMQRYEGEQYQGNWQAIVGGSRFVSAVEIGDATPTLTIDRVHTGLVESMDPGGEPSRKLWIYFREASKGWILNVTNSKCIAAMFGNDVSEWPGKRLTIHTEEVRFGPRKELGIRVTGSPDIDAPVRVEIKMPRRTKPDVRTMQPTGNDDGNGGMGDRE